MNFLGLGPTELIIILVIVLVLFGPKRLPQLGKSLGKTVKSLQDALEGKVDEEDQVAATSDSAPAEPTVTQTNEDV